MSDATQLEGALLIMRKLDEMDQHIINVEQGLKAILPVLEHMVTHGSGGAKAPTVASFEDIYGDEGGVDE